MVFKCGSLRAMFLFCFSFKLFMSVAVLSCPYVCADNVQFSYGAQFREETSTGSTVLSDCNYTPGIRSI